MLALNFYPHLDPYHAAFRLLALCRYTGGMDQDAYRILDYFSLFPFDLTVIRHRGGEKKRVASHFEAMRPYKWNAQPASTFLHMSSYQDVALSSLKGRGVVIDGVRVLPSSEASFDPGLLKSLDEFVLQRKRALNFVLKIEAEFGLYGEGGLKDRSSLMTFKYDVKRDVTLN